MLLGLPLSGQKPSHAGLRNCLSLNRSQSGNRTAQKHLFLGKREAPPTRPRRFVWVAKARGATPPLLREVQAAEEGLEAGVGADPGGVWALAQGVCVPGAHVYAVPFRVAAALVAACGMSVGFLPWGSSHKGALDRIVLPPHRSRGGMGFSARGGTSSALLVRYRVAELMSTLRHSPRTMACRISAGVLPCFVIWLARRTSLMQSSQPAPWSEA